MGFIRSVVTLASNGELADVAVARQQRWARGLHDDPRARRLASIRSTPRAPAELTRVDALRRIAT
ncbi:hypothetical protein WMF31_40620 [Sorangium sp. So ce1036]|uniref:hypothetical protein n=1 Tax=Sorangium sp. So ce1036 TaxID=3133328 RepID=UPI003F066DC9